MKLHHVLLTGSLGVALLSSPALAQNIDTQTTSTTLGSTTFGYLPTEADIETFIQVTVGTGTGGLTCAINVGTGANECTPDAGNGVAASYVRVAGMPGSFTDSPIAGTVSTLANFACGPQADGNGCGLALGASTGTGPFGQTIPSSSNVRNLVGTLTTAISIGDGGATAGMPEGFINFTLDPSVAAPVNASTGGTTIDQFIDQAMNLGGATDMTFQQRDATIGTGNLIPTEVGGPPTRIGGDLTGSLVAFWSPISATDSEAGQGTAGTGVPLNGVGLVSRTIIDQPDADGFGGLVSDSSVEFNGVGGFPIVGAFLVPGLATSNTLGVDSFDFP